MKELSKSTMTALVLATAVSIAIGTTFLVTGTTHAAYDEHKSDKKYTKQGNCGTYETDKELAKLEKTLDKLFDKEQKNGLDGTLNCLN